MATRLTLVNTPAAVSCVVFVLALLRRFQDIVRIDSRPLMARSGLMLVMFCIFCLDCLVNMHSYFDDASLLASNVSELPPAS